MANYKVKDVRAAIEGLDDEQAVFGFIITINGGIEVPDGVDTEREPTAEEWESIVSQADKLAGGDYHSIWDTLWDTINDARSEVFPDIDADGEEN